MNKKLTLQGINEACEQINLFLRKHETDEKEIIRLSFALEETLLGYYEKFGEEQDFSLECSTKWGTSRIQITIPNIRYNPLDKNGEKDISLIIRNLYNTTGVFPSWQYSKGCNTITAILSKKKKQNPAVSLLKAITLAIVLGVACGFLPETFSSNFSEILLTPISDTLTGVITAIAGPVIFLSVVWGIYSIGDISTLEHIGKKLICRFFALSFALATVITILFASMFEVTLSGSDISISEFSSIIQLFLDMIPDNFFTPFVDVNPMHIIVLAIVFGVSLLVLGQKVSRIIDIVEQCNTIIQYIMSGINTIIPLFVFVCIFNMIIKKEYTVLLDSYKLVLLVLIGLAIVMLVYCIMLKVCMKVSIISYIKKSLPSMLVGLATGSSSSAYPMCLEVCTKKLGISKKIVDFGLPFGQVVYMPGIMVLFLSAAFAMSESYSVEVNVTWIIMLLFVAVLLSIASPPITGGALTCYTILFAQLGISLEAIAVIMILNTFVELLATAINIFCVQSELVLLSHSFGELDENMLKEK